MSRHQLLAVVAVLACAPLSRAQQVVRKHFPGFGYRVAGLGDLDGDSVRDYALQDWPSGGPAVEVYSGATGAGLFTVQTSQSGSNDFGNALAGAGDFDGDGVPDFVIGADDYVDPNQTFVVCGAVLTCSGKDGHVLQTIYGGADYEQLGYAVAAMDDVDGDGAPDLLAGAIESYRGTSFGNGAVRCLSGRTGALLYQVDGAAAGDALGFAIATLSDHDHDGLRDFAVKAYAETRICSGATGATITSIPTPAALFNNSGLAEIDDVDGDGEPEIATGEIDPVTQSGQVRVISIPTQTQLRIHADGAWMDYYGTVIATITDADGDGVRDYLVNAPGWFTPRGSASLFSGRTGERLYRFIDRKADYFLGWSIADAGDLDGDGRAEMLIGSPYHKQGKNFGAALICSGNDLWLNAELKLPLAGDSESLEVHGAPSGIRSPSSSPTSTARR